MNSHHKSETSRMGKHALPLAGLIAGLALLTLYIIARPSPAPITQAVELPWDEPPDYRIVYLRTGVAAGSAPARLEDTLAVTTVGTWQAVLNAHAAAPLDALILHRSALPLVDTGWLADAYWQSMVIAAFNIYAPELAELLDDPRIASGGFASEPYPGPFYLIVSQYRRHNSGGAGRSTDAMRSREDVNLFSIVLANHIQGIKDNLN